MIDLPKLFARLGRLAGILKSVAAHQQTAIVAGVSDLVGAYADLPSPVAALTRAVRVPAGGAGQILANLNLEALVVDAARRTLLETVEADQPNESWDIPKAVAEVIRQMKAAAQTVPDCAVAYSVSSSPLLANPGEPNAGEGAILVGLREPSYVKCDNVFAEQLRVSVATAETANEETWVVRGAVPATGLWSYDWPRGSGAVASLTTADPAGEPGTGQNQTILTDGSFEEWDDSTTPTHWTDTNCARSSAAGTVYNEFPGETRYSVSLVGTIGSLGVASFYQVLDPDLIKASTAYGVSFRCRLSAAANFSAFTAATIRAQLEDANAGTVITDFGGNNLRVEQVFSAHSEAWVHVSGVWITPRRLPAAVRMKISTEDLTFTASGGFTTLGYVDHVALFPLSYPYPGGPALGIVAGARPWQVGDSLEVTITNDRAGAYAGYTWQAVFDRFFGGRANGLYLPTGTPATLGDHLIAGDPPIISPPPPPPPPPSGSLSVHAFFDTDGDETQDAGELDAANRIIYVIGPVTASGATNADGDVVFAGLPPGDYAVFVTLAGGTETCPTNGDTATVTSGGTATANRGIVPLEDPEPPAWNLLVQTNRPFRLVEVAGTIGLAEYSGYTDASGNITFPALDGEEDEPFTVTLADEDGETALWNSYSDPNADDGSGFVADIVLGYGTGTQPQAVVNFVVGSPEEPLPNGRFTVWVVTNTGDYVSGRDVTIDTYGLTGTTDASGVVMFESPLIRRDDVVQITVESGAGETASWKFHGFGLSFPGPVTEAGTGWVGTGRVRGSAPNGGSADGLAIWNTATGPAPMSPLAHVGDDEAPDMVSVPADTFGPFNPDDEVQSA